jgi:hypothetical protein
VRETVGEQQGIVTLEVISLVAAVGISLLSKQSFDFASLRSRGDVLTDDARPVRAVTPDPVR